MRGLFSMDSPLMRFLGKVGDLMLLNLLFILTSVPLITIGASLTALHYTALHLIAGEESTVTRDYFRSFQQNFKQATAIWLLLVVFALLLVYDIQTVWDRTDPVSQVVRVLCIAGAIALVMVLLYVFAILAKFNNTIRGTLKNAVALALTRFPRTFSMFMLVFAAVLLTVYTADTFKWGLLFWLLIGFSFLTFSNCFLLKKTFDSLTGESDSPEEPEEDEEADEEFSLP